jgi:hypothetical protein
MLRLGTALARLWSVNGHIAWNQTEISHRKEFGKQIQTHMYEEISQHRLHTSGYIRPRPASGPARYVTRFLFLMGCNVDMRNSGSEIPVQDFPMPRAKIWLCLAVDGNTWRKQALGFHGRSWACGNHIRPLDWHRTNIIQCTLRVEFCTFHRFRFLQLSARWFLLSEEAPGNRAYALSSWPSMWKPLPCPT